MSDRAPSERAVLQLRLVVEAEDYDKAVAFYRDVLGLPEQAAFEGDGEARVAILDAGRATLEIANPAQRRMIDEVEVGEPTPAGIRVAFEVADSQATTERLVQAGAALGPTHRDAVAIAQRPPRRSGRSAHHRVPGARDARRAPRPGRLRHRCRPAPETLTPGAEPFATAVSATAN